MASSAVVSTTPNQNPENKKPMSTEESDRALALELQKQLDLEARSENEPQNVAAGHREGQATPSGKICVNDLNHHCTVI